MRWRVEISDIYGNQRLLQDVLSKLSIEVLEEEDKRFLVSDKFEDLETAGEVHKLASHVQSNIEQATKDDSAIQLSFKFGSVIEESKEGTQRKHLFVSVSDVLSIMAIQGVGSEVKASGQIAEQERRQREEERQERDYQKLKRKALSRIISAARDERAVQVQRLLQGDLTPQTMGHIADLIQDDPGNEMKNLVSHKQLSRFYRSINHPDVFGELARHIVSDVDPPPNPMSLEEARGFIRALADRWMEHKAGLNQDP